MPGFSAGSWDGEGKGKVVRGSKGDALSGLMVHLYELLLVLSCRLLIVLCLFIDLSSSLFASFRQRFMRQRKKSLKSVSPISVGLTCRKRH